MEEAEALGENQLEALPMEKRRYFLSTCIRIADVCCRRCCCKNKEADKENPIKLQHSEREREKTETATASITSCNNNFAPINQR